MYVYRRFVLIIINCKYRKTFLIIQTELFKFANSASLMTKKKVKNSSENIKIIGAKLHNLKNISVDIPREKLVVITGLSGSGKSSLAFDTIYAEGQRRYVESLSAYARQFLSMMEKPDVDQIDGLSPAISIEQKSTSHNPRSTVGTVTEIYDYLRLLFARIGTPICPDHNEVLASKSITEMCNEILTNNIGKKVMVLAPVIRGKKGEHLGVYEDLKKEGFVRAKINDLVLPLEEFPSLNKNQKHNISAVVDRLILKDEDDLRLRLAESLETALNLSEGIVEIEFIDENEIVSFSSNFFIRRLPAPLLGITITPVLPPFIVLSYVVNDNWP